MTVRNGSSNMFICCQGILWLSWHLHGDETHLVQPLHVVRLHPVPGNRGIPSVAREIVNEGLEEFSELSFGLLNVDISTPDNKVSLRGCLTRSPSNR